MLGDGESFMSHIKIPSNSKKRADKRPHTTHATLVYLLGDGAPAVVGVVCEIQFERLAEQRVERLVCAVVCTRVTGHGERRNVAHPLLRKAHTGLIDGFAVIDTQHLLGKRLAIIHLTRWILVVERFKTSSVCNGIVHFIIQHIRSCAHTKLIGCYPFSMEEIGY
jgi:hypothetical protein